MSKNGLRGLIALIMVAVIGFGLFIGWGIGSKWGEIKNIKDYFNGWGQNKPDDGGEDKDGSGVTALMSEITAYSLDDTAINNAVSEDNKGNAYVTYAENTASCVISVKVVDELGRSPEDLQDVTWRLSDENAGLTMSAVGTQATFYASDNGFNKQITATCTSNLNESVSKTFTFDCAYK